MLIHPEFDPIAFHVGPVAVRWYGLMYLVGFVLFVVLGKHRARQNLLTGWHPRDVDDMLLYGVFGVILGGRLGYVLFYKPLYYLANPLEIAVRLAGRHELPRRLSGRPRGALVLRALAPEALARRHRFRRAARAARPRRRPDGQLHQRRAVGAPDRPAVGHGVSGRRDPSRAIRRSSTSSASKAWLLFAVLWIYTRRRRPLGAASGLFLVGYGLCRFIAEYAREPDRFLGYLALGLTMGQWLSLPMIAIGAIMLRHAYRRADKEEPTVLDRMK